MYSVSIQSAELAIRLQVSMYRRRCPPKLPIAHYSFGLPSLGGSESGRDRQRYCPDGQLQRFFDGPRCRICQCKRMSGITRSVGVPLMTPVITKREAAWQSGEPP